MMRSETQACAAVARELTGFIWAIARTVSAGNDDQDGRKAGDFSEERDSVIQ